MSRKSEFFFVILSHIPFNSFFSFIWEYNALPIWNNILKIMSCFSSINHTSLLFRYSLIYIFSLSFLIFFVVRNTNGNLSLDWFDLQIYTYLVGWLFFLDFDLLLLYSLLYFLIEHLENILWIKRSAPVMIDVDRFMC